MTINIPASSYQHYLNQLLEGSAPEPPVAKLIGFKLTAWESGKAEMIFHAAEQHTNPMGTVHGGILCDFADAAMGMAYASQLGGGESFTTVELKMNFFRPVRGGELTAKAELVHSGRTMGMVQCDVADREGRLVARASCTCMTLRGDSASDR